MRRARAALVLPNVIALLWLSCLGACGADRSKSLRSSDCCSAFQHWDTLPDKPVQAMLRLAIGGDSRDDRSQVVPWAFEEARRRGAKAFIFLGDMEITRLADRNFARKLRNLGSVPFYPVIGNHEVKFMGIVGMRDQHAVEEFVEDFLRAPGVKLAPLKDKDVAYAADLTEGVHFIALDNVSRRRGGFGAEQLDWLERDLKAARAANQVILVGMHKPLAKNPVTAHAMDEDGPSAVRDSDAALALFKKYGVAIVFVSHSHMYASYRQDGVEMRLTGGLGAPLVKGLAEADGGFHHFLLLDVPLSAKESSLGVEVVKFHGKSTRDDKDESLEVED